MKGWQWLAVILVLLIVAGALWNRYGRQKIYLATDAEIRAVVPADLLPLTIRDPAAGRRLDQLSDLWNRFRLSERRGFLSGEPDPAELAQNMALADSAVKLIRQGISSPGVTNLGGIDFGLPVLAKVLEQEAKLKGRSGDSRSCEKALVDCMELGPGIEYPVASWFAPIRAASVLNQASEAATFCVRSGWLKLSDLEDLISSLPPDMRLNDGYADGLRDRLQMDLFDPKVGLNAQAKMVDQFSRNPDEQFGESGNFDVLETAKLHVDLYREAIANATRPWVSRDVSEEAKVKKLISELPAMPASTGKPSRFEKLKYRMEMNAIPNSRAIAWLDTIVSTNTYVRQYTLKAGNRLKVFRLLAALWAAKEEHGAFPSSLEDLVRDRYLAQIPVDGFTGKPMIYDSGRHTITAEDVAGHSFVRDIAPFER